MKLELALKPDHVEVVFINDTASELRLWEYYCPEGWWSVAFHVKSEKDPNVSTILHLWNMEWSGIGSGPNTFVLQSADQREFSIDLNNGYWMRDALIPTLKDERLLVRIAYQSQPMNADELREMIESSPRGQERWGHLANVFVGSAMSEWVESEPPHSWLFGPSITYYRAESADQLMEYPSEEALGRVLSRIDYLAWFIELHAKAVNRDPVASCQAVNDPSVEMTVGHFTTAMLDYALEIQRAAREAQAYLAAQDSNQAKDDHDRQDDASP
jgi:hypothetical protein